MELSSNFDRKIFFIASFVDWRHKKKLVDHWKCAHMPGSRVNNEKRHFFYASVIILNY